MSVLLVEDDALVRTCLVEMLDEAGLPIAALSSAAEVLALPDGAEAPCVLVTDVNLGAGMDGFALAAAARQRWPGIRAVLISGDVATAERASSPAERFLAKPFHVDDLVRAIGIVHESLPAVGSPA